MNNSRRDERFFASTRGQVVSLLRGGQQTVDELATALGLTDNAIRAHLTHLERDGLVRQGAARRSGGKPAFTFELTEDAERLFPRAYALLLNNLLRVMRDRIPEADLADLLREVGHRLPVGQPVRGDLQTRVEAAIGILAGLGGQADFERTDDGFVIRGCTCPLSAAVEATPDACLMAEALLQDAIGAPVRQVCDPGPPARCHFEVRAT